MGMFDGIKQRRAQKKHDALMQVHGTAMDAWNQADARIDGYLEAVQDCINGKIDETFNDRDPRGFMLDNGEFPIAYIVGTGLLQVVRGPGRYEGGYGGVSFPLFGGIRGHVGGQRGQYVKGAESQTVTDSGETMITNVRVMFRGDVRTEEWKFSKMMSMEHGAGGITVFSMSSKSKPSAIGYGEEVATEVQFRLEIGAAFARDTLPNLLAQLKTEKAHHLESKPVPPVAPTL